MGYKYSYNSKILLNEDNNSYYILGLFITDGNVYINKSNGIQCELKSIDYDLLYSIKELICSNLPLKKSHNNCFRLRINNKEIGNWFINKGCVPNKTKIVKFPDVPKKYLSSFIRGLIDGDGSIGFYNNNTCIVRFDSASLDLISSLNEILISNGIFSKIHKTKWITSIINNRKIKSTTQMYRLTFTGLTAYKLLKFIYNDDGLYLVRKRNVSETIFSYIERNGFYEKDLLRMDRLPVKKWNSNLELFTCMINHKGSLKEASKELNVSAWGLSCKLRKIGIYDEIRKLYPIDPIKNLRFIL